jgi:hypothetical protein
VNDRNGERAWDRLQRGHGKGCFEEEKKVREARNGLEKERFGTADRRMEGKTYGEKSTLSEGVESITMLE